MKPTRTTALLLFSALAALSCGKEDPTGGGPTPPATGPTASSAFAIEFIGAHDQARAGTLTGVVLNPAPSPALGTLTWSQPAANVAQGWANGCTWAHNPDRGADGTARGENLFASAPAGRTDVDPAYVVTDWGAEYVDYSWATNTCAAGKVCGHYTQVVWRTTTKVGCAMATCSVNSPWGAAFPTWDFFVCDYEPPGNWVGEKPY